MTTTTVATTQQKIDAAMEAGALVPVGKHGLAPQNYNEMFRFCSAIAKSGQFPAFKTTEQVLIAVQTGMELGLSPMRSLSTIYVVNGKPSVMGDTAKALVISSGALETGTRIKEWVEDEHGKALDARSKLGPVEKWDSGVMAVCEMHRRGDPGPQSTVFTVGDARRAGLWNRKGVWSSYPRRMLKYRALGFHIRDHFSDVLLGFYVKEEMDDMPVVHTTVSDVSPEPPKGEDPLLAGSEE